MRKDELTKDFIVRKRNEQCTFQEQLDYLEKFWQYANAEVPGLPEPYSCSSDGDSYAIYWKMNDKTFWADVFDWHFLWIYTDHKNQDNSRWWDEEDIESPNITDNKCIPFLNKLLI